MMVIITFLLISLVFSNVSQRYRGPLMIMQKGKYKSPCQR